MSAALVYESEGTYVSYSVEHRRKGEKWEFSHTPDGDENTLRWVEENPGYEARITKTTETTEVAVVSA